jgi:apolipoprotein N-acyltransferase
VIVLTTQSTYQRAAVSDQLLRTAQLRAAELQRPVIVAATTGRSAAIDATGQRVTETKLYGADLLVTQVELTSGETPFARWGDLLAVAAAGIMLGAPAVQRSPRRIPTPDP